MATAVAVASRFETLVAVVKVAGKEVRE